MVNPVYSAAPDRYENGMKYRRAGNSGILLPEISLGLWQNFGDTAPLSNSRKMLLHAFDHGICHFDLANNYGPSYGSAESTLGKVMQSDLRPYRDELFISTKAGWDMWPGPYGNWGSRKYLMSSLDQSLKRMKLEYVDIFYTHRHDPETSLDETLQALTDIVRSGKALYVGVSNYPARLLPYIYDFLAAHGTPCLLHQAKYNIFDREPEIADSSSILSITKEKNSGFISYSPLAQGLLTDRYLNGIPTDSRAARNATLQKDRITPALTDRLNKLNDIARKRGQSLAQMALAWNLKDDLVTSVIIGASSVRQIDENLMAIQNTDFSSEEIEAINRISLG